MKKNAWIIIVIIALTLIMITCTMSACSLFESDNKLVLSLSLNKGEQINEKEVPMGSTVPLYVSASINSVIKNYSYDSYKFIISDEDSPAEIKVDKKSASVIAKEQCTVVIKAQYYYDEEFKGESNAVTIKYIANNISTVDDLKAIANSNESYVLANDIDLSGEDDWTPIAGFSGMLSGEGHSIKGLKLRVRSDDNIGLFGELKGTVTDLKLTGVNIIGSGSGNNIGAVAGKNSGTIRNCEVSGNINVEFSTCVGGVVGYSNANLFDNTNNATVSSYSKVGGVAGCLCFKNSSKMSGNINKGNISGEKNIGGVAGSIESIKYNDNEHYNASFSDCKNEGEVRASDNCAGGIAGYVSGAEYHVIGYIWHLDIQLSDCENSGKIIGKDYVGGIYGMGDLRVTSVTTCVNSADITGDNYVGGYVGYSSGTALSNMNNEKTITGKGYIGGIVGYAGRIENCKNSGTVASTGAILEKDVNKHCLGGVAGYCTSAVKCENSALLSTDTAGDFVGGVVGELNCNGSVADCINSGDIQATGCNYVGGIVGKITLKGSNEIKENINSGKVQGLKYVGGIAGSIEGVKSNDNEHYTAKVTDCENKGEIEALEDYAGGIAGYVTGAYYPVVAYVWILNVQVSHNINRGKVVSNGNFAAIVGRIGAYINQDNDDLWNFNTDYANIGKLYN